jgi:hypothetical protein
MSGLRVSITDDCEPCATTAQTSCDPCGSNYVSDEVECPDWVSLHCTFWLGDDIAFAGIKKNDRGSVVVIRLVSKLQEQATLIADLQSQITALAARVTELENP